MAIDLGREASLQRQQLVIADIRSRTGRSFMQLGSIDTSVAETARAVLPVLADWVALVPEENVRAAIYSRFNTKHANAYLDEMLKWARSEPNALGRNALVNALATAARSKDGVRIWQELKKGGISSLDSLLLTKLSTFPSVGSEVKERVLELLGSKQFTVGDLQYIAKIRDPRIQEWFKANIDSGDPRIRAVSRRVADQGKELPRGFSYATDGPDRRHELFSAEVDVSDANGVLAEMESRFGVEIPTELRRAPSTIWSRIPVDRWLRIRCGKEESNPAVLWLRLEDVDVVELVLTSQAVGDPDQRSRTIH